MKKKILSKEPGAFCHKGSINPVTGAASGAEAKLLAFPALNVQPGLCIRHTQPLLGVPVTTGAPLLAPQLPPGSSQSRLGELWKTRIEYEKNNNLS